ncbi:MAG: sulfite exporter TauE/SafE family protein [Planctomycetaceae bacterium]|nr:sulfite exporter TauE/SafE family protein [Planctomycetaceae bacterium]MCB9950714.1 sulfite exporter TauE/SafE family protein [Planctomycetaceae bacterium]
MQGLWLLLFGMVVGVFGGLFGIGGGLIIVPGLMLFFGLTQRQAQGTSLAVMIPPIGFFGALAYYNRGDIKLPIVGWVALGFMIGAYFGAVLHPRLPLPLLRVAFGLLLLYVGFTFVMYPAAEKTSTALPPAIAAIVSGIVAWALRKKRLPVAPKPESPNDDDTEYHI